MVSNNFFKKIVAFTLLFTLSGKSSFAMFPHYYVKDELETADDLLKRDLFQVKTRPKLETKGNIYNPEPIDENAPLDRELVLNQYWKTISEADQPTKDAALKKILKYNFSGHYHLQRYHIAGALYAGANPNNQLYPPPLSISVARSDYTLCKLLFERKADPNVHCGIISSRPLFMQARTRAIAELFFKHGAQIAQKDKYAWMREIMRNSYDDPSLITFAKEQGISACITHEDLGESLLIWLAYDANAHCCPELVLEKANTLLEGLSHEQIQSLIRKPQTRGETLLEYYLKFKGARSRALKAYLELRFTTPPEQIATECPICLENPPYTITQCKHLFCKTCLKEWHKSNTTCPICRNNL